MLKVWILSNWLVVNLTSIAGLNSDGTISIVEVADDSHWFAIFGKVSDNFNNVQASAKNEELLKLFLELWAFWRRSKYWDNKIRYSSF